MALTENTFKKAFDEVNRRGFFLIDLGPDLPKILGEPLYLKMDAVNLPPDRSKHYNEVAFYWFVDRQIREGERYGI